ncbi:MAG: ABC transporter substrate-binding protein [Spirochaetaceae bacterium]|nr:ABC transporter substrate-binding protein [Spirochaetaceae bacterium]MCF7951496.1 ABC transporter substrate-binding protein [Spirochaetaceae bacterium]
MLILLRRTIQLHTLGLCIFLIFSVIAHSQTGNDQAIEKQQRLAVFTPTTEGNTYWPEVHNIMKAAAEDLGIQISFHEFDVGDRFTKKERGVQILNRKPTPDAAIFSVAFGQAKPLVEAADELDIPFFIQGPLFPNELEALGDMPRKKIKNWIGYFHQDEVEKGYLLGRALIEEAIRHERFAADGTVQVAGVGGDPSWFGSNLREEGLRRAVAEYPKAQLMQTVPTRWTPSEGREMTLRLLERYPELSVVWAASDQLALGVVEALQTIGHTPEEEAFTGGLDLSMVGLEAIQNGVLTATAASTMLIYAEIVVYLYDYLQGIDFAVERGAKIKTKVYLADHSTANFFIELQQMYLHLDFTDFSKYHNKNLTHYDFTLQKIQEIADEQEGAKQ